MSSLSLESITANINAIDSKRFKILCVFLGVMVLASIGLIFAVITMKSDGNECTNDPFGWGASNYAEQINGHIDCTCQINTFDGRISSVSFNEAGVKQPEYFQGDFSGMGDVENAE